MHVVKTENLNDCYTDSGPECNWWCELIAAVFFWPCSLCQVARQVYGYDEFDFLDGDAKWNRPDNWEEQTQPLNSTTVNNAIANAALATAPKVAPPSPHSPIAVRSAGNGHAASESVVNQV